MKTHHRCFLALAVLALGLIFSLAANVYLFRRASAYYRQLNALRLDPIGLAYHPDAAPPASALPVAVFYGDSRAAGWPAPAVNGYTFVNRGIGSQTTTQVLARFADDLAPLEPEIVILQVGINDLKTIPIFPADRAAIVGGVEQNIQRIVEQSTHSGALVILCTIFPEGPVPPERRWLWSSGVGKAVVEVNAHLRALEAENVVILDAYALLAGDDGRVRPEYSLDALHLNDAGYQRLNAALVEILESEQITR